MKNDDLDKTQLLPRDGCGQRRNRLDDTQELPPLGDMPEPSRFRRSGVRELPPRTEGRREQRQGDWQGRQKEQGGRQRKKIRGVLIFAACFAFALFCGFLLSNALRSHEQALEDSRREAQQMQMRQQELSEQETALKKQKTSLAEQKKALEEKERELEKKAERASGRNERISQEKSGSVVGDFVDKVTGKEKERQRESEKNASEAQQAQTDIASVKQSIQDAQALLEEVDHQLDNIHEMKTQADKLKLAAETVYSENEDTIHRVLAHLGEGIDVLRSLLR